MRESLRVCLRLNFEYCFDNMAAIKPYQINVPEASIKRLRQKLELTDFPQAAIPQAQKDWKYGAPL